ncbi:PDZ domain-containing protein [Nocardia transvalensis]|uniref:YlbL family protein n=1 Tax=Nocardia transvalensis TaxID=37333 RepID=UPI0018930CF6|nr:PDZ domain-containing protein [Nocardia transvalensis]MBF6327066.1 PDZ domain-containing protein [Nocardia transvalensis]
MNRRILTLLAALIPVLVLGVVGSAVTVPFVALGPGPTFNTLGEVDGKQVVDVQGAPVDPTAGNLNMTTVSVRDGLNIFEAFGLWADGRYGLRPRAEVYPPGIPRDEVDKSNAEDFKNSENNAEMAALHYLKYPTVVKVRTVTDNSPAKDLLRTGDEFVSVAGKPITAAKDVVETVRATPPGTAVPVVVRRSGQEQTVEVKVGAQPEDSGKGYLGVTLDEQPNGPVHVDFNLSDIGGPSAGLMFSLALVDKMSTGKLNGGKFIAGTGTIDPDGKVGPIGGIQYKMMAAREAGAEAFLVPADNCDEARQRIPSGLKLVKVDNLTGAVQSLEAITTGKDAPTCG